MNNNRRLILLGALAVIVVVAVVSGVFKSQDPAPGVRPAVRVAQRPAPKPAPVYEDDPEPANPAEPTGPATQPDGAAPATQPLAAGPATAPIAGAPVDPSATQPAAVAATDPATRPAEAVAVTDPPISPATIPASPATGPAVAEAPATQPTTGPAVAAAPSTQPSTEPAVAAAEISVPLVDPNDPRPYGMRLALAKKAKEPPSTRPAAVVVAPPVTTGSSRTTGSTGSSRTSTSRDRTPSSATSRPVVVTRNYKIEKSMPLPEDYAPVLERSLFSKDRPVSRTERPEFGTGGAPASFVQPPAFRPESRLALRGLVIEDDNSFAFLENLDTGAPEVHRLGEKVAQGKIAKINANTLVYETADGKQTTVMIGNTFDGQPAPTATSLLTSGTPLSSLPPAPGAPPAFGGGTPGGPAATGPGAPAAGGMSTLEMLMRRRRQEQGGRPN
jgi:hypothetical protein